jgi:molecular chaperone GrpE
MPSSRESKGDQRAAERGPADTESASEGDRTRQDAPGQVAGEGRPTEAERDLAAELAQMEDRYKRALADLDNYRKRSAREAERRVEESREALLRDWLEAIDSVERALWMDPESPMSEGLRAVLEQMEAILARQGVQRIGAAGEPFDPERHEAVGVRPTNDQPDRTVAEVARSGFELGGRVLRPAQVIVGRRQEAGRKVD